MGLDVDDDDDDHDHVDDGDIYIMVKCLSVTKNQQPPGSLL